MKIDLWGLLGISCLVIGVMMALALELGSMLKHRRELLEEEERRRKALQENLHGLVLELCETDHESGEWLLRQAFADTLTEYRGAV